MFSLDLLNTFWHWQMNLEKKK